LFTGKTTEKWLGEIAESFGAGKIESSGTDKADDKADDKATENTNTFFQRASDVARRQLGTGALKLVWPTMGEVRDSNLGYATGGSIPGTGEFILMSVCRGN
jgi:tyrosyl-DNA phosphodiesterase-1